MPLESAIHVVDLYKVLKAGAALEPRKSVLLSADMYSFRLTQVELSRSRG